MASSSASETGAVDPHVAEHIHHIQRLMTRISDQYQRGALKAQALESAYEDLDEARHELGEILRRQAHDSPRSMGALEDTTHYLRHMAHLLDEARAPPE